MQYITKFDILLFNIGYPQYPALHEYMNTEDTAAFTKHNITRVTEQ